MTVPEWHESKMAVNLHPAGRGFTSISWLPVSPSHTSLVSRAHTMISKEEKMREGLTIIIHDQASIVIINRADRFIVVIPFISI